jgi:hypothetical protein
VHHETVVLMDAIVPVRVERTDLIEDKLLHLLMAAENWAFGRCADDACLNNKVLITREQRNALLGNMLFATSAVPQFKCAAHDGSSYTSRS